MGLEPMTLRLKVWCSTDWANRAYVFKYLKKPLLSITKQPEHLVDLFRTS